MAGLLMALRCASLMRGNKKPLELELRSNKAEGSGLVVPIPTLSDFWAMAAPQPMAKASVRIFFMCWYAFCFCFYLLRRK
ncbi:MAG: hypothetical protein EAZ32_13175 [Cytophagia bacterium]|nr:MAG: hypothetical protein EAZ38_14285 [Cytophagales bacterium]TAG38187.1 MAG: hypothetical protein EAZ32_13175 [Cytophagia bacterium]TAG51350.1 MAG: hypothetical protein EAZ29_09905 [Runella slithyformis]